MSKFLYTTKDKRGEVEKGEIDASSKIEASDLLSKRNLIPLSLVPVSESRFSISAINALAPIPATEKVIFARELATLVNAGIPLSQSLRILEKQTTNALMKKILSHVVKDVEGGTTLSEALGKHPKAFSPIFVNMVHAGEVGGILDDTLIRIADQVEKDHELVSKIRGAMMYPAVIFIAMNGAVTYMMISIIPQLATMFEEMNAELPTTTKFLIFVSELITTYGLITFPTIIATIFFIRYIIKKVYTIRRKFHQLILKIPVIGKTAKKMNITKFSRTFGALMASGISIVETLNIIADATTNILFKEEIRDAAAKVKDGKQLGEIFEKSKNFPVLVSQMISVGEETGTLSEILIKVAEFYDKELDNTIKNMTSLLEPLMMLMIGTMIGFIMISIITPIYQLTNLM